MDDFNPYAAPEVGISQVRLATEADEGRGVWKDGDILVMAKVARLPSRCLKCNEPATIRIKRSIASFSPWLLLLVFLSILGVIILVVTVLMVRRTAKIELPLCEKHRTQRSKGILIAWIVSLSGIFLWIAPMFVRDEWLGWRMLWVSYFGMIMFFVGLIFGIIRSRVVATQKIDDTHVWLKKVSPIYLAELPNLPYPDDWEMEAKPKGRIEEL